MLLYLYCGVVVDIFAYGTLCVCCCECYTFLNHFGSLSYF